MYAVLQKRSNRVGKKPAKKHGGGRHGGVEPRSVSWSLRMGLVFLAAGAVLLFLLGSMDATRTPTGGWRGSGIWSSLARLVGLPLLLLFGKAAYVLPLALIVVGIVDLGRFHYIVRARLTLRVLLAVPVLSILLTCVQRAFVHQPQLGGSFGDFFLRYLENFLGPFFGRVGGSIVSAGSVLFLIGISPHRLAVGLRKAARSRWLFWFTSLGRKGVEIVRHRGAVLSQRPELGCTYAPRRPDERPQPWTPNSRAAWNPGLRAAPWINSVPGDVPAADPETVLRPLPAPAVDEPLPLEILPEPRSDDARIDRISREVISLQRRIIDVVRRIAGVDLVPFGAQPQIGLNSLRFEFAKEEGQVATVRNVARSLADIGVEIGRAPARVEIKDAIRVELPLFDDERRFVPIVPLLQETTAGSDQPITYLIGRFQDGHPCELDVHQARHVLVGGSTGGGKTVLLHSIVFGVAFRYPPSRVRLALADFKVFEFGAYRGLPHLWQEVATTTGGFANLVENLFEELQMRKRTLAGDAGATFPVLITIIDEFSGCASPKLIRLISEARALNMFFVLATQHPTAEVISTAIKANMVTGIAFRTQSHVGSRLIIGSSDATSLKTNGDCLVQTPSSLARVQAAWVTTPQDGEASDVRAVQANLAGRSEGR